MSGKTDGTTPGEPEPIGSVAQEAAKLLGAFSGWAKEQGEGFSSFTAADADDAAHEHADAGAEGTAAECAWCPVCRTVAAVRQTSPEVAGHLSSAAASLMLAISGLMAPPQPGAGRDGEAGVQRIPLDDDWPEDDR